MKTCTWNDCQRPADRLGLCTAHYTRQRNGADMDAPIRVRSWAGGPCSVDGCGSEAKTRGWCPKHYTRWRKHGDPLATKIAAKGTWVGAVCSVKGCEKPVRSRGWCVAHYSQWEKHGDPTVRLGTPAGTWAGKECVADGCHDQATEHGMCSRHRKRVKKHGDPDVGARETLAPDAPAVVYVVKHPHLGAGKVGVGNPDGLRVREHTKRGWQVVRVSDTMPRAEARQIEAHLLAQVSTRGFVPADDMPHGGYTETFPMADLPAVLAAVAA